LTPMKLANLQDLLALQLMELLDAEQQQVKLLAELQQVSASTELSNTLDVHARATTRQIERLQTGFTLLTLKPTSAPCEAMKGLVKEGKAVIKLSAEPSVRDAAIVAMVQRIEHYEMSAYGTVRTFAYLINNDELARLLQSSLDEEEATDKILSQVANQINLEALRGYPQVS
jgi:ferritin-like metal-binding protein YciE